MGSVFRVFLAAAALGGGLLLIRAVVSHWEAQGVEVPLPATPVESQPTRPPAAPVDIHGEVWALRLVSGKSPLPADYTPPALLPLELGMEVDSRILPHLTAMLADARAAGLSPQVVSAYRSPQRSGELLTAKTHEYLALGYGPEAAGAAASRWVAPPGTSEHQLGLAVDILSVDYFTVYDDLYPVFEEYPEFLWLRENCATYGFILRYPKDGEEKTGIHYEPWHFRYVGREHAQKIMEEGLCLEEYLAMDSTQKP